MTVLRDAELDCVLAFACTALGVPNALAILRNVDEVRFGASEGIDCALLACEPAFRQHVMDSGQLLVVPDASLDERFKASGGVAAGPRIGFYAGMPLFVEPGLCGGALSVFDGRPRDFSERQRSLMARIAGLLTAIMRQRRDAQAVTRLERDLKAQSDLVNEHATALAHSRKIFERSSAVAMIGVWECDLASDDSLRWTDGVYDLFELPRGSPLTRAHTVDLYDPQSRVEMEALRARAIREHCGFSLDARIKTALGKERWMRLTADVECENGVAVRIFGMKQDITEEKALWERARFLAEMDLMTGLANRSLFQATLSGLDEEGVDRKTIGPLLLVDLDGFKQVNDNFGHAVGDECLKQIAERLRRVCANARLVARIGGDEFAVLLGRDVDQPEAEACAARILDEVRQPIRWGEHSLLLGASIGVAVPEDVGACGATQLFAAADVALYAAKATGKSTFRIFNPQMKSDADQRCDTVRDVAAALADGQLDLHYQPKFRLPDGGLAGFEALLRRRMADGEVVPAEAFRAALDDPALSARLGNWVIEKALRQAGIWRRAGLDFGSIAINLSSAQLHDHQFAEKLIERITEQGLRPDMIEVEVTESVFLDNPHGPVRRILEALRQGGIRVALDDFGTGYASLAQLRGYPIDIIKIDTSLAQCFLSSPPDRAILETIVRLGSSLGLEVVAEGIETAAQLDSLRTLGCPFGQGFLFAEALPAADADEWLMPAALGHRRVA